MIRFIRPFYRTRRYLTASSNRLQKHNDPVFKKLGDIEHIRQRPDMYIGSLEPDQRQMWTVNDSQGSKLCRFLEVEKKKILYEFY